MGDVFQPQPMKTGQQEGQDTLSGILEQYAQGKQPILGYEQAPGGAGMFGFRGAPIMGPETLGQYTQMFNLPQYGGQLSQGMSGAQQSALGYGAGAMNKFFGSGGDMDVIRQSTTNTLKGTGGAFNDVGDVYAALDAQRKQGLKRDLGDLEEQFGVAGLSDSTGLHESAARRQTESEQNLMAEVARIAPQLIQSLTGQQQGAAQILGQLPQQVAAAGFNLGEAGRQVGQQDLDRMYNDFLRTQSLFPMLMQYFGNAGEVQYAPSTFQNLTQGAASAGALASGLRG
jgi:hypothetical protein